MQNHRHIFLFRPNGKSCLDEASPEYIRKAVRDRTEAAISHALTVISSLDQVPGGGKPCSK